MGLTSLYMTCQLSDRLGPTLSHCGKLCSTVQHCPASHSAKVNKKNSSAGAAVDLHCAQLTYVPDSMNQVQGNCKDLYMRLMPISYGELAQNNWKFICNRGKLTGRRLFHLNFHDILYFSMTADSPPLLHTPNAQPRSTTTTSSSM